MTFRTNKRQLRLEDKEPADLDQGHRRTEQDREGDHSLLAPLLILLVRSLNLKARSARNQDGL